ncbi:MAG TPA: beta-galactosidase [Nocardioidaceae bacterium]|nr:beta-galactosidase [Nocardioidaceae bacterium]
MTARPDARQAAEPATALSRRMDGRLAYGGDYNPEQWPEHVWDEDVRLMREAGVNLVTVGVFGWARLEPSPGRFEFGWLDRVLDLLHRNGVYVDLATATASPPPWFSLRYPQSLPQTRDGVRLSPGSRQAYCPSSPAYRDACTQLVERLAQRYHDHPALALWHVNNEYGCHVAQCYCPTSAAAFRDWLRWRYATLESLNDAWATSFWSQHYGDWEEIGPPRATPTFTNPTHQLDFHRFSSAELLDCYRAEHDVLRRASPGTPVTTNLMAPAFKPLDYWTWAPELDLVSVDHYLQAEDEDNHVDLALAADLTRSLAGGAPWLLMEHSTSAVNWQPRNLAKQPGQMRRNSLQHVARGADSVMFFQWRASAGGAEKFHSAMVPHAGTDTRVWRDVVGLGANLAALTEVTGSRVVCETAIAWDWVSWWAGDLDAHPSSDLRYLDQVRAHHAALWRAGVTADLVHPAGDLSAYKLLLVPSLYLVGEEAAANVRDFVERGGTVVIGCFSGIVDEQDHVRLGGYPGAFTDLLGVRVEEFHPLAAGSSARLDDGSTGRVWSEHAHTTGAEIVARYGEGDLSGVPAITRNPVGGGAWYVGTCLDATSLDRLLARVCEEAGVRPVAPAPSGVEVVRRRGDDASYLFLINHSTIDATLPGSGRDLLSGTRHRGTLTVPAGEVVVILEEDG